MAHLLRNIIFLLLLGVANSGYSQDLATIINAAPNQETFWSVTVRNSEGNILEGWNSDKLIIPASNQKLYTTATILDRLGSSYRFTTHLYRTGEIVDSVLYGNLIIRGVGDPSISGSMYKDDRFHVFDEFMQQLKAAGIREISGSLIANIGYFTNEKYPKGWDWDDLSFYYGVEIAPLSFNNNAVDLVVDAAGKPGQKPDIHWFPFNTAYVEFVNDQVIRGADTEYDEEYIKYMGKNIFYLGSHLPEGYLEEESLAITDAHQFFLVSFDQFLNQNGINTSGSFETQTNDIADHWVNYPIIATHSSEPLNKLVDWTNKESDNFYAEMLLRSTIAEKRGSPADFDQGVKEVRTFLGELGIDTTYVLMKDASGMASGNFTKTSVLSDFLVKMMDHPEYRSFSNSLSVAGIDGTIAHRMKGTPLYNNFRGKSGYVGGARTLSGYFTTGSGQQLIVSMAANNFIGKVRPIDAVHEEILNYLYRKY